jgi:hypothetical protein
MTASRTSTPMVSWLRQVAEVRTATMYELPSGRNSSSTSPAGTFELRARRGAVAA